MKIKKKEFLSLKQGGMSVAEYRDKFTEMSRYAAEEVAEDRKKQELFLDGLAGSLQYQLMSYPFPNFQQLVDAARGAEEEGRQLSAVWECVSPALQPTDEHPVLLWGTGWKLWAAAVPTSCLAVPAVRSAVSASCPSDSTSSFPRASRRCHPRFNSCTRALDWVRWRARRCSPPRCGRAPPPRCLHVLSVVGLRSSGPDLNPPPASHRNHQF
jgi:hypothetical protein